MGKDLVLIGGGHAHMVTLANLHRMIRRGHRVTVIGPSEHHYYSGMGPGMLSGIYSARQIRFATRRMVEAQGGRFIKDRVTHVDPHSQTVFTMSAGAFPYDVLSFNSGSYVAAPLAAADAPAVFTVKPIEGLLKARKTLISAGRRKYVRVAVVGGGAAAIEMAGNAHRLLHMNNRKGFSVHLYTQGKILDRFPSKVRQSALSILAPMGVQIHEHNRIADIHGDRIEFTTGPSRQAEVIFLATGVQPSAIIAASGLPTGPDGGLAVNRFLQSVTFPNIFGGGDCIYFQDHPLEKVGVHAVRQNPVLYHNLSATLDGMQADALKPFSANGSYLLILNMGNGTGVLYKWGFVLKGRLAFHIKDYIDRRFMRKFQTGPQACATN